MRPAQWQTNQNGTHYSDHCGFRISVKRAAPRSRSWDARIEGKFLATFKDVLSARLAAELAAEQRAPHD